MAPKNRGQKRGQSPLKEHNPPPICLPLEVGNYINNASRVLVSILFVCFLTSLAARGNPALEKPSDHFIRLSPLTPAVCSPVISALLRLFGEKGGISVCFVSKMHSVSKFRQPVEFRHTVHFTCKINLQNNFFARSTIPQTISGLRWTNEQMDSMCKINKWTNGQMDSM